MKSLARLIAWRYLFSTRQRFVPLLSLVALGGIALGVFSLLVVLSVMKGFQGELQQRWIGLNAHLTISKLPSDEESYSSIVEFLSSISEIAEISQTVDGEVIIQRMDGEDPLALAAKLVGKEAITPSFLKRVEIYPKDVSRFSLAGGEELLKTLGTHPDFNESVKLIYPFGEIGPTGDWVPNQKTFKVSHIFRTGLYEWDAYRLLVPLKEARELLGEQGENSLQIRLKDLSQIKRIEERLDKKLADGVLVSSFLGQNKRLFAALKLERMAMSLILFLFVAIASFSVVGLVLMFIDAKRRDLAILRAIGLSMRGARRIFLNIGGTLGGIGALVGGGFGLIACYFLDRYPIPLPKTYYLDYLPVRFQWPSLFFTVVIGFFLAVFSSWYPVRVASRMEILPMLKEE